MSARNKQPNKSLRRELRSEAQQPYSRIPVSDIPLDISTGLLTDDEVFMTRAFRRSVMASRGSLLQRVTTPAKPQAVKNMFKLSRLPLTRLLRERSRAARRAATAMYCKLASASGSKARAFFYSAQRVQLSYLKQINAEIKVRTATNTTD